MFLVQRKLCSTCIYRPDSSLDLAALEQQAADPRMPGHFANFRVCHHAADDSGVCCRGFWDAHKDDFDAGQLAQRLTAMGIPALEFIERDDWETRKH